jgi:uncharacterized membrane protein (TIGR02234 family)
VAEGRRSFGPVVLLGLASGGLGAVAGSKPWVSASDSESFPGGVQLAVATVASVPLAGALSLVVLACWGVILVTRGRVRRLVALLGAVAALGLLVATVVAYWTLPEEFKEAIEQYTADGDTDTDFTGWYAAALVAAAASVLSTLAAVRYLPGWPEMGSRYDAPTAERTAEVEPEGNLELWRALDEGHDPTASRRPLD